jgi:hypothetical protein
MTIHQCPKCELRFEFKTELDDHCRHDHPDFRHEYPAVVHPAEVVEPPHREGHPAEHTGRHPEGGDFVRWLVPKHPREGKPEH